MILLKKLNDRISFIKVSSSNFLINSLKSVLSSIIINLSSELIKKFGAESVVTFYGNTSSEQRTEAIDRFQNDPKCRFFVGTPSTGGYGITLTQASNVVYYSNGYDLEKRMQSEDRAHRIGQVQKVTYVDFIAEDTVDEKIVKSLRKKVNIATQIMGEELKEWI